MRLIILMVNRVAGPFIPALGRWGMKLFNVTPLQKRGRSTAEGHENTKQ